MSQLLQRPDGVRNQAWPSPPHPPARACKNSPGCWKALRQPPQAFLISKSSPIVFEMDEALAPRSLFHALSAPSPLKPTSHGKRGLRFLEEDERMSCSEPDGYHNNDILQAPVAPCKVKPETQPPVEESTENTKHSSLHSLSTLPLVLPLPIHPPPPPYPPSS